MQKRLSVSTFLPIEFYPLKVRTIDMPRAKPIFATYYYVKEGEVTKTEAERVTFGNLSNLDKQWVEIAREVIARKSQGPYKDYFGLAAFELSQGDSLRACIFTPSKHFIITKGELEQKVGGKPLRGMVGSLSSEAAGGILDELNQKGRTEAVLAWPVGTNPASAAFRRAEGSFFAVLDPTSLAINHKSGETIYPFAPWSPPADTPKPPAGQRQKSARKVLSR